MMWYGPIFPLPGNKHGRPMAWRVEPFGRNHSLQLQPTSESSEFGPAAIGTASHPTQPGFAQSLHSPLRRWGEEL